MQQSLAIYGWIISYLTKYLIYFGTYFAIGQIFIVVLGQNIEQII